MPATDPSTSVRRRASGRLSRPARGAVAVLAAVALFGLVAACSSDDDSSPTTTASAKPATHAACSAGTKPSPTNALKNFWSCFG